MHRLNNWRFRMLAEMTKPKAKKLPRPEPVKELKSNIGSAFQWAVVFSGTALVIFVIVCSIFDLDMSDVRLSAYAKEADVAGNYNAMSKRVSALEDKLK